MGGALALALDRAGYDVSRIVFRTAPPDDGFLSQFTRRPDVSSIREGDSIASDAVFITTQDSEIASAAIELEALIQGSSTVFITSGAQSSKSITNLRNRGARIGSIHPLVSVSDPVQGADRLKGAFFCVEGDLDAVDLAEVIVRSLGGRSFTIPTDKKPLYHAAAWGRTALVELLIARGANVNAGNKAGVTPLAAAEKNGFSETAAVLRQHGAK